MNKNREGNLTSNTHRECSNKECHNVFEITSKTVTICPSCNSERVKSQSPEKKMLARAKSRAKERNHNFNLELSDINIPKVCPILGIEIIDFKGKSGGQPNSPALDRIDNSKGYIKGNIQVISHLANQMKASANQKELLLFAKWITNTYSSGQELTTLV